MSLEVSQRSCTDGAEMHEFAKELWPLHRSITGNGLRETLKRIGDRVPELQVTEVPSGTQVFDWVVPPEWTIRSARLLDLDGNVVVDYENSNLHLVGYSIPVNMQISFAALQEHLHSIPEQPNAIPYVTSYYNPTWGFCLTHEQRSKMAKTDYLVQIDSELKPGSLTFGEAIIPGSSTDEIFISTYICHPSMANNELSGPVVATALAQYVSQLPNRHYTYRFAFTPETVGAISYASSRIHELKGNVVAAINLSCIGDDRAYTYLASRNGNLRIDRLAKRIIRARENVMEYSYLERGSDERHYGAPGLDLPMISLMRSRYADYPEYHTSLDDLENVVTPSGLQGGFDLVRECIETLESEKVLLANQIAEPQLGRRGLYHVIQKKSTPEEVMLRTNILAYSDGHHTVADMSELFNQPIDRIESLVRELEQYDLIHQEFETTHTEIGPSNE